MRDPYVVILSPLRTEKGTNLLPLNKYFFWVDKKANKAEIKSAIREIYKVEVKKINTVTVKGKKKRVGRFEGRRPDWKKAIVTLAPGEKVDFFEGL